MTGAVTVGVVFLMGIYWLSFGTPLLYDAKTMYSAAFNCVTIVVVGWLVYFAWRSKNAAQWSTFAYAFLFLAYGFFAVRAYSTSHPLIVSMAIDLSMALAFALGTRIWHTVVSGFFVAAVTVSIFTYLGLIPLWHRPHVFVDWSQQDLNAILGYMAMIAAGLAAGDGGFRVRDWFGRPSMAAGYMHRSISKLVSLA